MIKTQLLDGVKLADNPHHNYIEFPQDAGQTIFFNSNFDSGNCKKVIKNSYDHYSIWTASDAQGTPHQGYPKSWFYFEVGGFKRRKISFSVHRVHFLWAMTSKKQLYRPVFRVKQLDQNQQLSISKWQRLPHPIASLSVNNQQQLVLKFDFYFLDNTKSVQFAFTYPYSHQQCRKQSIELQEKYGKDPEIFFKSYQLCKSYEGRIIDMFLLSSHEGKDGCQSIKGDQFFTLGAAKLTKFRNNKPIIFISARVHPIETPSSFTLTGILQFLLNKQDYRAHLLRKYFVFVLVPMLNPDGVSNGHCRMDALNQNLNRYYKNTDPVKQPSCYSVIKLCEHYNKDKRLFMYLDLHAHPANKGNFIFGNAIFDYIEQVESNLFPKILSQNCINFEYEQCIFSRKHMKAKDRNEDMNKQGCARVVFYKQFGLTHSYTLECGYHCNAYNNNLQQEQNTNKSFIVRYKINQKGQNIYDNFEQQTMEEADQILKSYVEALNEKQEKLQTKPNRIFQYKLFKYQQDPLDNIQSEHYQKELALFTQQIFYNLGKNICISILDIWNKNPYTRVLNISEDRKQIAEKHAKLDRFRKEQAGIKTKQKKIVELIESQCYNQWYKRNIFQFSATEEVRKSNTQMKRSERIRMSQVKGQISLSSTAKFSVKGNTSKLRQSILRQEKKMQIVQPQIESIKTIALFEQAQLLMTTKANQQMNILNVQKTTFRPLMNVRIRNIQLNK